MIPEPAQRLPPEVQAVLKTAIRAQTPCGPANLVWHIFGEDTCLPSLAPVVLLHGGSGSWTHWLRNIFFLVDSGRRVLVPDLPGFGDSAAPPGGTDADAVPEPLEQGLHRLLGGQACDLAGFSFGGMVAGLLAVQFPYRVNRLVLVGAPGLGIAPQKAVRLRAWRHLTNAGERREVHRSNLSALMLLHPESVTETALALHEANVLRDRMQGRRLSRTDVLLRSLVQVRCPVHAIYGARDALFDGVMAALKPALQQAPGFSGLTLVEGAGHWVQFEQPEAFNQVLLPMLSCASSTASRA